MTHDCVYFYRGDDEGDNDALPEEYLRSSLAKESQVRCCFKDDVLVLHKMFD